MSDRETARRAAARLLAAQQLGLRALTDQSIARVLASARRDGRCCPATSALTGALDATPIERLVVAAPYDGEHGVASWTE